MIIDSGTVESFNKIRMERDLPLSTAAKELRVSYPTLHRVIKSKMSCSDRTEYKIRKWIEKHREVGA